MKKFICVAMSFMMVLFCVLPIYAVDIDNTMVSAVDKEARVKNEVLSGSISNDQDVIDVAFAQYIAKMESAPSTCNLTQMDNEMEASLTITQDLGVKVLPDGSTVEETSITGLLITDQDGRQVSASEYAYEYLYKEGEMNSYDIYASTTVFIRKWLTDDGGTIRGVYRISTTFYGTDGFGATLQHFYSRDHILEGYISKSSSVITGLIDGNSYDFYPNDREYPSTGDVVTLNSACEIKKGSESLYIFVPFRLPTLGT